MTTTTKVELPVAYVKYIRSIPMFSALTEEELGNIIKADDCIERTCLPRFKIIREGEVGDCMFVLLRGHAHVVAQQSVTFRDGVVAELFPGDYFGEEALFPWTNGRRNASIVASQRCRFLQIDKRHILYGLERGIQKLCYSRTWDSSGLKTLAEMNVGSANQEESQSIDDLLNYEERIQNALLKCRLFESLSAEQIKDHHEWSSLFYGTDGEYIVREGEPGEFLYLILEGEVEVITVGANGKLQIITKLSEGKYFGEQSLTPDGMGVCNASVRAKGNCVLIQVEKVQFLKILRQDDDLAEAIQQVRELHEKIIALKKSDDHTWDADNTDRIIKVDTISGTGVTGNGKKRRSTDVSAVQRRKKRKIASGWDNPDNSR